MFSSSFLYKLGKVTHMYINEQMAGKYDGLMETIKEARQIEMSNFNDKNPAYVAEWITQRMEAAQLVLNGLQMATQISEIGGITQTNICTYIDAMEVVREWIVSNYIQSPKSEMDDQL